MQAYGDGGYEAAGAYCGKKAGIAVLCAWSVIFLEILYLLSFSPVTPGVVVLFILFCLAGAGLGGAMIYFSRSTTATPGTVLMGLGIPLLFLPIIQLLILAGTGEAFLQMLPYILTLSAAVVMLGGVHASIDFHEHPVPRKMGGIAAIVLLCFQVYFLIDIISGIIEIQKIGPFLELMKMSPIVAMPFIIGFFFIGGAIFTGVLSLLNMTKPPGDDSMARMAVTVANLVGYVTPGLTLFMLLWMLVSAGAPGEFWLLVFPFTAALLTAIFAPLWPVALGISLKLTASLGEVQAGPRTAGEARAAQSTYDPRPTPEPYRRAGQPGDAAPPAPPERISRPDPSDYRIRALNDQLQYGVITQEEYDKKKKEIQGG